MPLLFVIWSWWLKKWSRQFKCRQHVKQWFCSCSSRRLLLLHVVLTTNKNGSDLLHFSLRTIINMEFLRGADVETMSSSECSMQTIVASWQSHFSNITLREICVVGSPNTLLHIPDTMRGPLMSFMHLNFARYTQTSLKRPSECFNSYEEGFPSFEAPA